MNTNCCPWCSCKAVDITTSEDVNSFDRRPRYMCIGEETHEWREGDGPDPDDPPRIILANS